MVHSPFFSLIIPTYNRADRIENTLKTALNQSYANFEIIVVDDGSTDHTAEIVRKIQAKNLHYFYKNNAERAAARNFGIQKAKGLYLTFLDSDDMLYKHYFSNAYEHILKLDYPQFFHLAYEILSSEGKRLSQINQLKSDDISIFVKGNPLSCMGVFLHNSLTKKFQFNEDRNLSGSEDWELWIRIAANFGIKTNRRVSAALITHQSRSVLNFNESQLLLRKNLAMKYAFEDKAVNEKFKKYFSKIESYWDSYIALHLILSKKNRAGLRYLWKAIYKYPLSIFERRFLAIVKHFILNFYTK